MLPGTRLDTAVAISWALETGGRPPLRAGLVLGRRVGEVGEAGAESAALAGELGGREVDQRERGGVLVVGETVGGAVVAAEGVEGVEGAGESLDHAVAQGEGVAEHDQVDAPAVRDGGRAVGSQSLAGEVVGVGDGDVLAGDAGADHPPRDLDARGGRDTQRGVQARPAGGDADLCPGSPPSPPPYR